MTEVAVNIRSDMDTVRLCIGIASGFMQVYPMFLRCFVQPVASILLTPRCQLDCAYEGGGTPSRGRRAGRGYLSDIPANSQSRKVCLVQRLAISRSDRAGADQAEACV